MAALLNKQADREAEGDVLVDEKAFWPFSCSAADTAPGAQGCSGAVASGLTILTATRKVLARRPGAVGDALYALAERRRPAGGGLSSRFQAIHGTESGAGPPADPADVAKAQEAHGT